MNQIRLQHAAALLLLAAAIAYRLCAGLSANHSLWLPNFSPVAAIALCGAIFLAGPVALFLPLAALFLSDLALNAHYGASLVGPETLSRYVALALIVAIGWSLRDRARIPLVMLASAAGSILFYVVTNTASWLGSTQYAPTPAGWVQALTTGVPGYPPTWMFFRNSLVSDLLFTGLFLGCMAATKDRPPSRTPSRAAASRSVPAASL